MTSRPMVSWVLVAVFGSVTLGALASGKAETLKYVYPALALGVAVALFYSHREFYVGYVWWLWFVTPLVRRLVDYRAGYDPLNPVLVAPALVTGVCLVSLIRHLPKVKRRSLAPLLPILAGLAYAYPLGVYNAGLQAATFGLLQWLAPIAFGFHLATDVSRYIPYLAITRRVFTWAAFALGLYGVWQYCSPLPWDRLWMFNSGMTTIGRPLPFEVRVFSTLNSPTPFAMVMVAGLLMLLETRPWVHVCMGLPAYFAFLLSLVRTAWGGWLIGVGVYATYLRPRAGLRVAAMLGLLVLAVAFLTSTPLGSRIERRLESFTMLGEDRSLAAREASSAVVLELILNEPLGRGLGATGSARRLATSSTITFDNGFLNVFFSLGWAGGLLYLAGTAVLLVGLLRRRFEPRSDPIPKVARAVGFATFATLSSLNTLTAASGVIFWGFLGLSLSARAWYRTEVQRSLADVTVLGRPRRPARAASSR
jgi:O-antigen ligase